ncbi:MAG: peptide deformylase [Acetobacter sp.]|nr:peptide deformylase [Acetobacter sp.]
MTHSTPHALSSDEAIYIALADAASPLTILTPPHPTLRQKARAVRPDDMADIRVILPSLFATMYKAPGIGLAAPQVGISQRFLIIDLGQKEETKEKIPKEDPTPPLVMINPEIIQESEEMAEREEGCLSLPSQYADVVRPKAIRVRWMTITGETREYEADGLLATCIQHEIDHLNGVLFVDHLSALRRNMILRRLSKKLKQS